MFKFLLNIIVVHYHYFPMAVVIDVFFILARCYPTLYDTTNQLLLTAMYLIKDSQSINQLVSFQLLGMPV
jgi:hypothetical protein